VRRGVALFIASLAVAGCSDQSMTRQNRYNVLGPAALWSDGAEARSLQPGTVAQGDLARQQALADPPEVTSELLATGQREFGIFCSPCHGLAGDGDGMIVSRGFPKPPSYHSPRLRAAPVKHFVDVITNGYGVMYSYAVRVPPHDRWAIGAYVRALQLSRHANVADAPEAKEKLR
jgi:mono/diheme cytochrome c family protein